MRREGGVERRAGTAGYVDKTLPEIWRRVNHKSGETQCTVNALRYALRALNFSGSAAMSTLREMYF